MVWAGEKTIKPHKQTKNANDVFIYTDWICIYIIHVISVTIYITWDHGIISFVF